MKLKRIMAIVLCFAMVLSTMSFNVFAEDATVSHTDSAENSLADNSDIVTEDTMDTDGDVNVLADETGSVANENSNIDIDTAICNEDVDAIEQVVPVKAIASINGAGHTDLQSAIDEAFSYEDDVTVVLEDDFTGNVTITEKTGLYLTLDGNGKSFNGTITIVALSDTNDNRRITIKNVNFVDNDDAKVDFITSTETNHYPRITVKNCSFTGSGNDGDVAIRTKSAYGLLIEDCEGKGLHSFLQNTSGWNLEIENVTVTDSKSGLALGTVQGVTVKGCDIDVREYGIRLDAQYNNEAVIEDNNVKSFIPVVVRKASVDTNLTFKGTNNMTASNTDSIWCAIGESEYEENGNLPTAPKAAVNVICEDIDLTDGICGYTSLNGKVPTVPAGSVTFCYTGADCFWGEATANAEESFVIKLFEGDKQIASSELNNIDGIIDGAVTVTWNIPFAGSNDSYWNVVWAEGYPKYDMNPTAVKLFADGVEVSENVVRYNAPDDLNKIVAFAEDAEGNVKAYTNLEGAVNSANVSKVSVVRDTTLKEELTLPANITFNGNGKNIEGNLVASGDVTFAGHTKVSNFNAGYNKPVITIGKGACLELTGAGRMVIGHGATFNITGEIEDAKAAAKAKANAKASLIMPGASFTGAGVDFNVTNAYISAPSSYCSSSKSASSTFNFNFENSIWESAGKLAFEAQSTAATVNFNFKDSVLKTGSHLVFGVDKGVIVIDNSIVNEAENNYRQLENRSNMTIKNGSVVYASVATSSNANHPGTLTVDNATFISTGEFSGANLGQGTLIVKNGASFTTGTISNVNYAVDKTSTFTVGTIKDTAVFEEITVVEVKTYKQLIAALAEDNAEVKMMNDITATATQATGYGKAGIVVGKGDMLDGNGYTLTINGANSTWDCAIAMTGGTVKNLTVAGAMRGIFMPGANDDIVIDGVVFEDVIYTFNSDAGSKDYTVTIKNTELNGWTSFSNAHKAVTFEKCSFAEGNGYAYCRPYQGTTFVDCDFAEDYEFDTKAVNDGKPLAFNGCIYDNEPLSEENGEMFYNGGNVIVNGEPVEFIAPENVVAKIGGKSFASLEEAFKAAESGCEITLFKDLTISDNWDCRNTGAKFTVPVTINGNGKTLTFKGNVDDRNWNTIFRFEEAATVKNLTIDVSAATGVQRVISTKLSITAENVNIIGNGNRYGIIFGESAGSAISDIEAVITNSTFKNCQAGVSDNANGQDAKSVSITGSTFNNAGAVISAYETITFNGNNADGNEVNLSSYTAVETVKVSATGNTLTNTDASVTAKPENITADDAFLTPVAKIGSKYYTKLSKAIDKANTGDTITMVDNVVLSESLVVAANDKIVLDLNGKTITATDTKASGNYELFANYGELTVIGNGTIELEAETNRGWGGYSAIFFNRGGKLTIENGTFTHKGGTDMAYVVDNSANYSGDSTTNINGGSLSSTYVAIRNYMDKHTSNGGASGIATVNVTGGNIYGYKRGIWAQIASTPAKGNINISGGTVKSVQQASVLIDTDDASEINAVITGGTFSTDVSEFLVEGASLSKNLDGTFSVVAERIIKVSASEEKVVAGQEFTVTVKLTKGENIFNAYWELVYEADKFELKDSADQSGIVKEALSKTYNGEIFAEGEALKTYTFVAKAVAEETTGNFTLSNTEAYTFAESRDAVKVAAANNNKVPVTIIMKEYEVSAKLNDEVVDMTVAEPKAEVTFNGKANKFVVETNLPDGVDYEITYTVDGTAADAVELTNVGEYVVGYTITTENGYANKSGTVKITVSEPEFVVEATRWTTMGKKLVLVYTNQDALYFTYNGNIMIDVTAKGYEYENKTKYPHVFAYVTDNLDIDETESYKANVKYITEDEGLFILTDGYSKADINFSESLNVQDISVEYGIVNLHSEIYSDVKYQKHLLKGDTNGDKIVNGKDTAFVVSEVKIALGIK